MNTLLSHRAVKPLLFVLALLPLASLIYGALSNGLGAEPGRGADHAAPATGRCASCA